jgi:methyl acetate hydrolase
MIRVRRLSNPRGPREPGQGIPGRGVNVVDAGRIDSAMARVVDAGLSPGAVAMAADSEGVIYSGAFGCREAGDPAAMTLDTVFWIASMTKLVTSVAAMQLVEQGRLALDEPLSNSLPELAAHPRLVGFDPDSGPILRPVSRPITLRHLLSHTSGFGYTTWNANLLRYDALASASVRNEDAEAFLFAPLVFDPGERWEYGIGVDWAGVAVERVSGQSLEEYFREHIFDPLGMRDSGFALRPDQTVRLAAMHARMDDVSLARSTYGPSQPPRFFGGGGDLYSTGPDYLVFLRAILGDGQHGSVRILKPETVCEMGRNQIGDLPAGGLKSYIPFKSNDVEFFPGMKKRWGLGTLLTTAVAPSGRSAGSWAWAGLANTYYWIDHSRGLTGLIMTQILPFGDPAVLGLFNEFEREIYSSMA